MQVPPTTLRKKIGFWQFHGLLLEKSTDTFHLVEKHNEKYASHPEIVVEEYESESAMASAQDQREEELQVVLSDSRFHRAVLLSFCFIVVDVLVLHSWDADEFG